MSDDTKLGGDDRVQVTQGGAPSAPVDDTKARALARKKELADRKAHLQEVEKRVKRDDYSPEKIAQYRAALARARAEVKALEQEAASGND